MDTPLLVGIILMVVVAFFAWQWWSAAGRKTVGGAAGRKTADVAGLVGTATPPSVGSGGSVTAAELGSMTTAPPKEEKFPEVAGQSEEELRAKEPVQMRVPSVTETPVAPDNMGPPTIPESLRHPEQSFHQPATATPSMTVSDVPAGRAATGSASAPGAGGSQLFTPEMAQNGGPIVGNSVFAFDGMEPTSFAAF